MREKDLFEVIKKKTVTVKKMAIEEP